MRQTHLAHHAQSEILADGVADGVEGIHEAERE